MAPNDVSTSALTVDEWMHALAQPVGAPGGGAAAGVMLSIAAGLMAMVAGYTESDTSGLEARVSQLNSDALRLADDDARASRDFGAAFREGGAEREEAILAASIRAAESSAALGRRARGAIPDLEWLAANGKPALLADVAVAVAALRATISGARANLSFDLRALHGAGEEVRREHPELWSEIGQLEAARSQLDALANEIEARLSLTDRSA